MSSSQHAIVGYIYVPDAGGWWIKPTTAAPLTPIDFVGQWSLDITTGGIDPTATAVAVFLVPRDFAPPRLLGVAELPDALYAQALAFDQVER